MPTYGIDSLTSKQLYVCQSMRTITEISNLTHSGYFLKMTDDINLRDAASLLLQCFAKSKSLSTTNSTNSKDRICLFLQKPLAFLYLPSQMPSSSFLSQAKKISLSFDQRGRLKNAPLLAPDQKTYKHFWYRFDLLNFCFFWQPTAHQL